MDYTNTIGRRKTSIARIYMAPGKGEITINDRAFDDYFPAEVLRLVVKQPLETANETANYDIKVNLTGGGLSGQAEALRLAIARALADINPDHRPALKKEGYFTRDPRMVERKKYGRRKARRRFQFSKR